MDKNAIKKYAVWARRELISRVTQKALQYGITENEMQPADAASVNGAVLSAKEKKQRQALIKKIHEEGFEQVMEEAAYTWFNRFSALRFMEVNGYLPTHVRVFTDDTNAFKPQILAEAINLELEGLEIEKIYVLKEANDDEKLFKYLLITQCNALNAILPGMFQEINDYTELLFPDNLLREDSAVAQMIAMIPQEDWKNAVQILGWLYQYYNTEKKDEVFAALKKNVKITKENIPAATQLFTPDWIVRYMVENSLGRLFLCGQCAVDGGEKERIAKEKELAEKFRWKYYLPEAEQTPEVRAQLNKLAADPCSLPAVKCIDPCSGSGHILVCLFDVLVKMYEVSGYTTHEAVASIVENNLYGLEIDTRAAQLTYFAVMMTARRHDRRFFSRGVQPHVYAVAESNHVNSDNVEIFANGDAGLKKAIETIVSELHDAKEYGSILTVTPQDWSALYARFDEIRKDTKIHRIPILDELLPLVNAARVLAQKYDVVVTNPPYMGGSGMDSKLGEFVKKNYPDSKSDMFAVFIEKCGQMTRQNGYQAMITQHAWMFLSSFEKLRAKLLSTDTVNMVHLGARAFDEIGGEVVQTTSFVLRKSHIQGCKGVYCRLIEPTTQQGKEDMFLAGENRYESAQDNFAKIPGAPIAYWVSDKFIDMFSHGDLLGTIADSKQGLATADNNRFLREWFEVCITNIKFDATNIVDAKISCKKWFPYNKGGEFRKWYGNNDFIVNWENDGYEIRNFIDSKGKLRSRPQNTDFYFHESVSWSLVSSSVAAFRYKPFGHIFDVAGMSCFSNDKLFYLLALCNTNIVMEVLKVIAPTINYQCGDIANIPVIFDKDKQETVDRTVEQNISISQTDWDSFETSWDFGRHPLVRRGSAAEAYAAWECECSERFSRLKANEEELNRIFIEIYGLQDELTPEVEDKDVTVRKADLQREVKSLLSYAVGCMFGRYSLDAEGLAYAGGDFREQYSVVRGLYYRNDVLQKYGCEKLSGSVRPHEESGGVDSEPHRRETGTEVNEGICEFSFDRARLESGASDAEFLNEGADETGSDSLGGSRENAVCSASNTDPCLLNGHFGVDRDNIIPICVDEYFEDDIVGRFVTFLEVVYGKDTLEENLKFIAGALGGKGQPREVIRNYFLNDFYADHLKIYQKRPIYWLFDSGKKNGFKCLIYLHRYQPDTIARIRTDYVHEQQGRYRTAVADLENRLEGASASDRVKLTRQLETLQAQAAELHEYEEKIHHLADQYISIDLDDGVKVNYAKFQDVLAKIK